MSVGTTQTAACIHQREPWVKCPNIWLPSEPQRTSGGMIPTERCTGCGQARLLISLNEEVFDEMAQEKSTP